MQIYKKSYKNSEFKISAPTWNEELNSVSDIQDHFAHFLKKHGEKSINPSIRIYSNRVEHRILFKLKQDIVFNF